MNLTNLLNLWRTEPARVTGFVTAIIVLLMAYGVPISLEQKAAILGLVGALLALFQAEITRANVTPVAEVGAREVRAFYEGAAAGAAGNGE